MRVVRIAASSLVVTDGDLLSRECRVLPDGEDVVSTTCLRLVTVAGKAALRVIELRSVDSATTEANTIVLEASITEAIAYEKQSFSSRPYNKQGTPIRMVYEPLHSETHSSTVILFEGKVERKMRALGLPGPPS